MREPSFSAHSQHLLKTFINIITKNKTSHPCYPHNTPKHPHLHLDPVPQTFPFLLMRKVRSFHLTYMPSMSFPQEGQLSISSIHPFRHFPCTSPLQHPKVITLLGRTSFKHTSHFGSFSNKESDKESSLCLFLQRSTFCPFLFYPFVSRSHLLLRQMKICTSTMHAKRVMQAQATMTQFLSCSNIQSLHCNFVLHDMALSLVQQRSASTWVTYSEGQIVGQLRSDGLCGTISAL